MTEKTLLGFDYGSKRIGVAVGQTLTCSATPIAIVRCVNQKPDWEHISRLLRDWNPGALVVGIPLCMDDRRQSMTEASERFARQLQGRFELPVYPVDERLSSREAGERLKSAHNIDAVAAQVILETWFSQQQNVE